MSRLVCEGVRELRTFSAAVEGRDDLPPVFNSGEWMRFSSVFRRLLRRSCSALLPREYVRTPVEGELSVSPNVEYVIGVTPRTSDDAAVVLGGRLPRGLFD